MVLTAWAIGPFDPDLRKPLPFEREPDPEQVFFTKDRTKLTWKPIHADMAGKGFDLRPIIGKEGASAFLLTYVHSPKDQRALLQFQCDEPGYVLLNGERVRPADGKLPLALKEGWNVLLGRVASDDGSPFVSARIIGGEGLRVSLRKD